MKTTAKRPVHTRVRFQLVLLLASVTLLLAACSGQAASGSQADAASGSQAQSSASAASQATPQINDAGVQTNLVTSADVAPATPEGQAASAVRVNLLAAGDVVVHSPVWISGQQADGSYNFDHLFAPIADEARAADVALISQETILGGTELGLSGYPAFNGPQEIGDAEVAAGFDVMVKASNHVLDAGLRGIESELAYWAQNHPEIAVVGMSTTQEDYENIYVYEKSDFRIALLNYTYDTNGIPFPDSDPWATHLLDDDAIRADVARAQQMADLVIVWPHWGTEYQSDPDELQLHYAQLFCDLGVDVVIGSHPHTICPVELMQRDDGHQTLVFYSLGNFMSNQIEGVMTSVGAMVNLTLIKDQTGAHVESWTFEPTVTQRQAGTDFAVWRLTDYTDELAVANYTPLTRQACLDFCSQVLGEGFDQQSATMSGTM